MSVSKVKICSVGGCGGKYKGLGFCNMHYQRFKKHGNPLFTTIAAAGEHVYCKVADCDGKHASLGYCEMHYKRFKKHGDPLVTKRAANGEHVDCKVADCDGKHEGLGYCRKHYKRFKKHGDPLFKTRAAHGEGHLNKEGYRIMRVGGKQIFEHRHIMQQYLGRKLFPNENVHHINGVRDDNRLENLEIWETSQPAGQRIEDKINHSIGLLRQYGFIISHNKEKIKI